MNNTKKMVFLALMVSFALVLSIIVSSIPVPVAVPGVKLGLANIISMIVVIVFGFREGLIVVFLRCLLASLYTGGILIFLFSISGGILSLVVIAFLYKKFTKALSITGISIAGAVAHNIGQIFMASLVMKEINVFFYLPVLMFSGIITGFFIGLCTMFLLKALKRAGMYNSF